MKPSADTKNSSNRIILDAMGGDYAPKNEIAGAILAAREGYEVILTGKDNFIYPHIKDLPKRIKERLSIVSAEDFIRMDDNPSESLRKKRNSSLGIGMQLLKEGKASAFVSAGNTGAVMAFAIFILGRIEGITRPAIAGFIPTKNGKGIMLDMGANVDMKPENLVQFATMGVNLSKVVFRINSPVVGLLSIGSERGKGNSVVKIANEMLEKTDINYYGLVEGRDIFKGIVDVVVCDGFVGNTVLKASEGLAEFITSSLKKEIKTHPVSLFGSIFMRRVFKKLKEKFDYSEYGGAPLLGVNGNVIICHGSSPPLAIKNAIKLSALFSEKKLNEQIAIAIREAKK